MPIVIQPQLSNYVAYILTLPKEDSLLGLNLGRKSDAIFLVGSKELYLSDLSGTWCWSE